ncbi:MAG: cation acetate symporter, partial [Nocardioidaceae bacterium]|nr:cation acetate symporter [Nocardioidaceae bacterium]
MTEIQLWTLIFAILTFSVYIYIAYASRVQSTSGFYVAGGGIPAPANGAAIAADWMSAASFIS